MKYWIAGMQHRIASLWFPYLVAVRALRSTGMIDPLRPFVMVGMRKSALRFCSANAAPDAQEVKNGTALVGVGRYSLILITLWNSRRRMLPFLRACPMGDGLKSETAADFLPLNLICKDCVVLRSSEFPAPLTPQRRMIVAN